MMNIIRILRVKNLLDVVVHDSAFVQEVYARQEGTEPFFRVALANFYRYKTRMVSPTKTEIE